MPLTPQSYIQLLAGIAPLPCRDDLVQLAAQNFTQLRRAAEVGVFKGEFAAHNLRTWSGEYHAIDMWAHRNDGKLKDGAGYEDKNENDDKQEQTYRLAMGNINASGGAERVTVVRDSSERAARRYPDEHFDWIYVDTLHTASAVKQELRRWWPKLRTGGLFSGDDYADHLDTPFLSTSRAWPVYLRRDKSAASIIPNYKWGVMRATQAFAREVGAPLHATWLQDCYFFPAWWMVKPP